MSARAEGLALVAILCVLSFVFQVQMKLFASDLASVLARPGAGLRELAAPLLRVVLAWRPFFIGVMAGASFCIWLMVLARLDLSLALPLASVALAVSALGGGIVLGEEMTLARVMGIFVVALGIVLVLRS